MDKNRTVKNYFLEREKKMQPRNKVKLYPGLLEALSTLRLNKHNNAALMIKSSVKLLYS